MKSNPKCAGCRCGQADGECRKADALYLLETRRQVYIRRGRRALLLAMLAGDGSLFYISPQPITPVYGRFRRRRS